MTKKTLLLIRHAESESNFGLATSDPITLGLTERGISQADIAASSLKFKPELIAISPYRRAKLTAIPFLRQFADVPFEEWDVGEFVFLNFKSLPPMTREQRRPQVTAYWKRRNPHEENTDSESFARFYQRVCQFHQRVIQNPARNLMVISHGFFMYTYATSLAQGFPPCSDELMENIYDTMPAEPFPNCAVARFVFDDEKWLSEM